MKSTRQAESALRLLRKDRAVIDGIKRTFGAQLAKPPDPSTIEDSLRRIFNESPTPKAAYLRMGAATLSAIADVWADGPVSPLEQAGIESLRRIIREEIHDPYSVLLGAMIGLVVGDEGRARILREAQRAQAREAAQTRARRARQTSRGRRWHDEVEHRKPSLTKTAAMAHIERREGLKPGTVKKAIQRYNKRK